MTGERHLSNPRWSDRAMDAHDSRKEDDPRRREPKLISALAGGAGRTGATVAHRKRFIAAAVLAIALLATVTRHPVRAGSSAGASCRGVNSFYVIIQAVDVATAHNAIVAVGGTVDRDLPLVNSSTGWISQPALGVLKNTAGITSVTPDVGVHFQSDSSTPRVASGVFSDVIGARTLWSKGITGSKIGVAVIDTGIAAVPAVADRLAGGIDFTGGNDPFHDGFGHGTFVAGLIGGATPADAPTSGVAPQVNLISVKVGSDDGSADVSHVLAALQWTVAFKDTFGIRVVNLSFGTDSTQPAIHSLLDYAVERAWDAGLVVVTSASNLGPLPGTVTKPGDDPLVITAGAEDDLGTVTRSDDVMAPFSGAGPTVDGFNKPDLVAPGRSVISLRAPGSAIDTQNPDGRVGDAYFKGSGTSFAAAITSGAAALLLQSNPALTPDQVKGRLLKGAVQGPAKDPNIDGRGALNAAAAVSLNQVNFSQSDVVRSKGDGPLADDRGHVNMRLQAWATTPSPATSCNPNV